MSVFEDWLRRGESGTRSDGSGLWCDADGVVYDLGREVEVGVTVFLSSGGMFEGISDMI